MTMINLVLFFNSLVLFGDFVDGVLLHTKQGSLKGLVSQSRNGRDFYSFYSIPYAEPPLGELRFKVRYFITTYRNDLHMYIYFTHVQCT